MVDFLSDVRLRILGTRSTLSELQGINTTILKDGALVYVSGAQDVYCLLKESTQAPDGINIVQSTTGSPGRWFAVGLAAQANVYATQADWYVDEQDVTGLASDQNVGDTATTPLASYAELTRRIQFATLAQTTTVHLISDVNDDSVFSFRGNVFDPVFLRIIGEATVTLATLTSVAAQNIVVGATRPFVQLGAAWDPALVGERARLTVSAGAADVGTLFWLEEIDGVDPTIMYISRPWFLASPPGFGTAETLTVGGGDTFVVERLTKAGMLNMQPVGPQSLLAANLGMCISVENLRGPDVSGTLLVLGNNGVNCRTSTYGCKVAWPFVQGSAMSFEGCLMGGAVTSAWELSGGNEGNYVSACSLMRVGAKAFHRVLGVWQFWSNPSFMNSRMLLGDTWAGGAQPASVQVINGVSFWEWGSAAAVQLEGSSFLNLGNDCWGTSTGAASSGFQVNTGSHAEYPAGTPPTVSGTVANDINIGGVANDYAALPAAGQNPGNNNAWLVVSS